MKRMFLGLLLAVLSIANFAVFSAPEVAKPPVKTDEKIKTLEDASKPRDIVADASGNIAINSILLRAFDDPVFTQKKASLNVGTIKIRNLLDMLGRAINVNFFIDQAITGEMDLLNVRDGGVDELLRLICGQAKPSAVLIKIGNLWHITSKQQAQLLLKESKTRRLMYKVFPVNYANIDSEFQKKVEDGWKTIAKDDPNAYLYIDIDQKKIYAKSDESSLEEFYQYLREIDRPILQIRIDVVIILAKKDFFFDFGFDWSGIYNREQTIKANNESFGFYGLGGTVLDYPSPIAQIPGQTQSAPLPVVPNPPNRNNPNLFVDPLNFALNLFNSGAGFMSSVLSERNTAGLIRIPFVFGGTDLSLRRLNLILNMAEIEEKINVVSRPSILTSNNKIAKILIGQSIPLQTAYDDYTGSTPRTVTTVNYKDTGIVLEVRPLVSPDKKSVYLDILVEDSVVESGTTTANEQGVMVNPPTISVIKTKNEVVLKNGQTTIIGGLSSKTMSSTKRSVPFLSTIPLFGNFFKATFDNNSERERYIFITPTIIEYDV